jgi:hypothetical protein
VIVNNGNNTNLVAALNGYCIARSTNRGIGFQSVACANTGLQDGTALAVGRDGANRRQVYVTGSSTRVWRMDGDSMAFAANNPLPDPFPDKTVLAHPRMKVFNGVLYILRADGNRILANRLDAVTNATTWLGETVLASDVSSPSLSVTTEPIVAFDLGPGMDGSSKVRIVYTAIKGPLTLDTGIKMIECPLDLAPANCQLLAWSTLNESGREGGPSLRFGGGKWVVTYRKSASTSTTALAVIGAELAQSGILNQRAITPAVIPCTYGSDRWGEYNHLDSFDNGQFFSPYTQNGPGCRWKGQWTADAHIGGAAFGF